MYAQGLLRTIGIATSLLLVLAGTALADEPADDPYASEGFYSFRMGSSWRWEIIPDSVLYPVYVADPHRPTMSVTRLQTGAMCRVVLCMSWPRVTQQVLVGQRPGASPTTRRFRQPPTPGLVPPAWPERGRPGRPSRTWRNRWAGQ